MVRRWRLAFATTGFLALASAHADEYTVLGNWPTHVRLADGTDVGVSVLYQYDIDRFDGDRGALRDAQTNRRRYLGFYLRKQDVYDVNVQYDHQSRQWVDTFVRVRTLGLIGHDLGHLRFGYTKTPVGFEGVTSSGATTFIETALPVQAFWEGRRTGLDWAWPTRHWVVNLGWYAVRHDLNGGNPGRTVAARVAWVPWQRAGSVLHMGLSGSRETLLPDGGGATSVRFGARPEAGLAPLRLVDTGVLGRAIRVDRRGVEALWIHGPLSLQGEYLGVDVRRPDAGRYRADGWYAFATWTLTGESRVYSDGNVADRRYDGRDLSTIRSAARWGAVELALRYSRIDLDDAGVAGGREHDWTLGANWYLGEHLKMQANYVRVDSERKHARLDPDIFETRWQLSF